MESSPAMATDATEAGHTEYKESKDLLNTDSATPVMAVVAFNKGKDPSSSAAAAKTTTIATDAKVMVSTGHDECEKQVNSLLNNKDATTVMVVATVSSKNQQASEAKPSLTSMQLRFLAAASDGDLEGLTHILSRTGDVEEGNNVAAASLLESVTVEGGTALHLVAANGGNRDNEKVDSCVKFIHGKKMSLLYQKSNNGDTPLHCAARAGKRHLVSFLIGLAKDNDKVQDLLRVVNNSNDTALHEAIRRGDKEMVKELLRADPELTFFPSNGTSPLYITIQLINDTAILWEEDKQAREEGSDAHLKEKRERSMAQTLHDESKDGFLSYSGPNGQNALHAAVLRGPDLTRMLLRWNKDLTLQRDENGSTPLHFAAGLNWEWWWRRSVLSLVLEANKDALYQVDNDGLYPIHVAASVGASDAIALFLKECPGSAGLRDAKGRTFLHVAVDNNQWYTTSMACHNRSLAWIMNLQDNDGNTALHLAVKTGRLLSFSHLLLVNRKVDLNITNAEGQTPLDIAHNNVPLGLISFRGSKVRILGALRLARARRGVSRPDHFQRKYEDRYGRNSEYEREELKKLKDLTETGSIASVLIATVAFGATFALPGGYRADDHTNGGTPTLAGRYAFDAFMMANALAFILSAGAVISLVRAGSPTFDLPSRRFYSGIALYLMEISVTCLIAAFALGVFVVLSPVALKTAIAICVMSFLFFVAFNGGEFWLRWLLIAPSFLVRMGLIWTLLEYTSLILVYTMVELWPILLIFSWAMYGKAHPISKVEP